jgi:hypothetical protein
MIRGCGLWFVSVLLAATGCASADSWSQPGGQMRVSGWSRPVEIFTDAEADSAVSCSSMVFCVVAGGLRNGEGVAAVGAARWSHPSSSRARMNS